MFFPGLSYLRILCPLPLPLKKIDKKILVMGYGRVRNSAHRVYTRTEFGVRAFSIAKYNTFKKN